MNPKELEVLKLLLRSENAMSLPDILNVQPTLVKSTTAASLAKLLKDELIEVAGIGHSGKVICRTYRPTEHSRKFLAEKISILSATWYPNPTCACVCSVQTKTRKLQKEMWHKFGLCWISMKRKIILIAMQHRIFRTYER